MQIEKTEQFGDDYCDLSPEDRERVDAALRKLVANPRLPGLRVGKLPGRQDPLRRDIWYCRVTDSIRITFVWQSDILVLRRVGHHDILRSP